MPCSRIQAPRATHRDLASAGSPLYTLPAYQSLQRLNPGTWLRQARLTLQLLNPGEATGSLEEETGHWGVLMGLRQWLHLPKGTNVFQYFNDWLNSNTVLGEFLPV